MRIFSIKIGALTCIFFLLFFLSGCAKKKSAYDYNVMSDQIAKQIQDVEDVIKMTNKEILENRDPSSWGQEPAKKQPAPPMRKVTIPGTEQVIIVPNDGVILPWERTPQVSEKPKESVE